MLFVDLDDFKRVNDNYGHHYGDLFLLEIARRCKKSLRESDLIARFGGDEFVIALFDVSRIQDAASVAEKILVSFAEPVVINTDTIAVSASIGITVCFRGMAKRWIHSSIMLIRRCTLPNHGVKTISSIIVNQ
ncbi:GGDEF domain-containing protein [candidate division KSB1 bacterium]|nr:GGDEF domain-containing protein [candidate division KSB1 bacterium]